MLLLRPAGLAAALAVALAVALAAAPAAALAADLAAALAAARATAYADARAAALADDLTAALAAALEATRMLLSLLHADCDALTLLPALLTARDWHASSASMQRHHGSNTTSSDRVYLVGEPEDNTVGRGKDVKDTS
jgi:hypothetical protein